MRLTNKHNLPAPIVNAVKRDPYDRGDADMSVSEIIDSPRVKVLEWEHDANIEEDVAGRVFSLFGRATHQILEWGAEDHQRAEERLFYTVKIDGVEVTVSGAMDLQDVGEAVGITDWKVTTVWAFQAEKPAWMYQQNCYAHFVRNAQWAEAWINGKKERYAHKRRPVQSLKIGAILRDWSASKAKRDPKYPQAPIQILDLELWSPAKAKDYFEQRVRLHIKSRTMHFAGIDLPECSREDRWEDNPSYAVKKPDGKRAVGLYDTKEEALAHINDAKVPLVLETRGGEPKRCNDWCRVSQWCSQNQKRLAENAERE